MSIASNYVDVDLSVMPEGQGTGLLEMPADKMEMLHASLPSFEAARPGQMIPRSQWKDLVEKTKVLYRNDVTEIYSQGNFGSCFPAGTRIRMADGSQKPIEKLRLLDEVLTAEGNIGPVTQLFVKRDASELITLDVWGHRHLKMTPEHPVLTKRGYVEASNIVPGDMVAMPRYAPQCSAILQTDSHIVGQRQKILAKRARHAVTSGSVQGRKQAEIAKCPVPDAIHLTNGFGWIIGLFLAEGNTDPSKIVWTFGSKEKETHVQQLVDLLKSELNVDARVQVRSSRPSVIKVVVYGTAWASLFESICGTGSGRKAMHSDLTSGPLDFLEGVLNGWLAGDGYARRGYHQGVTVSHDLALNMYDISQFLGRAPAIALSYPKVSHGVKSRQPRWDVTMSEGNESGDYHCREITEKAVWRKVRGISKEPFSGVVYNFEVFGDNSYVAEGIGVHNCVGFGSAQMLETMLRRRYGLRHRVSLSGMSVYKRIGGGPQTGAMISDGMDAICEEGALPTDTAENKAKYAHTHPLRSWSTPLPNGWRDTAKLFRGQRFAIAKGLDQVASALLNGYCGIVGRQGHCIPYVYLDYSGNSFLCAYANSWDVNWNDNGFGYDSESVARNIWCYILLDVVTRPELDVPAI